MTTSERYTTIGCAFWDWKPLIAIGNDHIAMSARVLWLAFYSSPQAKRLVPGLWEGSLSSMADMLRAPHDLVWNALQRLREFDLIEHDGENRIVRLTVLPDATERAHSPLAIKGWWTRFITLPDTTIRNIHVHVLWWLVSAKKYTPAMKEMWDATFGTIDVPPNPVRLFAPLSIRQGDLFQNGAVPTLSNGITQPITNPLVNGLAQPWDQDPEKDQDLEKGEGESVRGEEGTVVSSNTNALLLPPANVPFTVDGLVSVVTALLGGVWSVTADQQRALDNEILLLSPEPDLGLLRDYLTATRCSVRQAAELLSGTGHLASAFSRARQWAQERDKRQREMDERAAYLAAARAQAGV